jgi:hypothetical protein
MDRYLEPISTVLEDAVSGMSDEQMAAARGQKWSAAQIIEHLSLAFGATAIGLERNASSDQLEVRRPTMRDRVAIFLVCRMEYIPSGRKAPEYTVPSGIPADEAWRKLRENLAAMDKAITRAEQRWGDRLIGIHPVLGPLKADEWRKFHMVHARHHAKQILAIKAGGQGSARAAA